MHRVLAGAIAIFTGLVVTALIVWLWLGGSSRPDTLGWTMIVGMFVLPVLAFPMALGLLLLEGIASWLNRPRVPVLLAGGAVLPLLFVLFVGGPYMLVFFLNPENVANTMVVVLIMGAAVILPCIVTSTLYALLTRGQTEEPRCRAR